MFSYIVGVDFDDEVVNRDEKDIYFGVVDKYRAMAIGNDEGTSTLFIDSDNVLEKSQLAKELGNIKIISFEKIKYLE